MSYRTQLLSRAASAVAPDPFGGLSEPLLMKNEVSDEKDVEGEEQHDPWSSVGIIAGAVVLGAAGVAASAAAMVTTLGMAAAVYVAGGLCVANSVTIVRNQYELSKGKGYRQGINSLRKEANRLGEQTELLAQAVNELQSEADLMRGLEEQLSEIAKQQGVNANEIVLLVRENEEILSKQKANLKQTFVSDMARAFISSEFLLGDMKVDLKNLPVLLLRLQIQLNSHGMSLDTQKFTEMVQKDNDVGNILKMCGDMLSLDKKGNVDADKMDMVTLDQQYSKGSVEAARGKAPQLISKKLEHRNTVVRDVKRGLSMKGIEIDLSSDESSVKSDYSPRRTSSHGERRTYYHQPRRQQRSVEYDPVDSGHKAKSKVSGKFKAAAKMSRFVGGQKRDGLRGMQSTNEDLRASRRQSEDDRSMESSGTGSRRKTRSVDKAVSALKRSSKDYDDAASHSSRGSQGKVRRKPSKFGQSMTRTSSDDDSAPVASRRPRSVDKALNVLRMSSRSGADSTSASSQVVRKSQSQPKSRRQTSRGMSPSQGSGSVSSSGTRRVRRLNSMPSPSRNDSGARLKRTATMGDEGRRQAGARSGGVRRRVRDDSL